MSTNQTKDPGKSRKKTKNPKYDPSVWETSDSNKASIPQAPKPPTDVVEETPTSGQQPPPISGQIPSGDQEMSGATGSGAKENSLLDNPMPPTPPAISSPVIGLDDSGHEMQNGLFPPMTPLPSTTFGVVTNEPKKIDTIEDASKFLDYQDTSPKSLENKSFADIFKDAKNIRTKGKLRFIPPVFTEIGTKHANIPDELLVKQNEKWLLTLVGCFIGKRPAFPFVKFHAYRLWKKYGLIDVILNDRGLFYFKFDNELGMQRVLEMRPWLFNDIPVLLKKWEVGVEFDKIRPTSIPLWVNFYDLAPVMWDYEVLSHIVSVLGVPLAIDRYTEEMCEKNSGRAAFARVLVRVNADQDLPPYVEAVVMGQMKKFRVQYFWKPERCSHCNAFGHKFIDCIDRPKSAEEMEATTSNVAGSSGIRQDDLEFILPKKRRRRPQKGKSTGGIVMPKTKVHYVHKIIDNHVDPKGKAQMNTLETTDSSNSSQPVRMPPPEVPVTAPSTSHLPGDADEAESQSTDPGNQGADTDPVDISMLPDDPHTQNLDLEVREEVDATIAIGDLISVNLRGHESRIEELIRSSRLKI